MGVLMVEDDTTLSALGVLLERHRGAMSKREAARQAGISEGRWRQIVTGRQKAGGGMVIPVNPRRDTVIAMAQAVGADVSEALELAGFESDDGDIKVPSQTGSSDATIADVAEAIRQDDNLVDEAKQHLLNQYNLLRRLSDLSVTKDAPQPEIPAGQRPLRAVARKRPPRTP